MAEVSQSPSRTQTVGDRGTWEVVPLYVVKPDSGSFLLESSRYSWSFVAEWSFLTNHARVLVCIAHDPGVRLRDIAATIGITERSAFSIVTDLTNDGYVAKHKDGRRNRYQIQPHRPFRDAVATERTIGEVLDVLVDSNIDREG
jgi:hypothetical protein